MNVEKSEGLGIFKVLLCLLFLFTLAGGILTTNAIWITNIWLGILGGALSMLGIALLIELIIKTT